MRALSVLLLLALVGCDSQAPDPTSAAALDAPPLMAASKAESVPYRVTEAVSVGAEGEAVLLTIEGETFAFDAGQAYLLGQALARAGFETLDPELAAGFRRPRGGDKCEPPLPGSAVARIGGQAFGGDRCPPPPPPGFMERSFLSNLLDGNVEVITAPKGLEWLKVPGGFVAEL